MWKELLVGCGEWGTNESCTTKYWMYILLILTQQPQGFISFSSHKYHRRKWTWPHPQARSLWFSLFSVDVEIWYCLFNFSGPIQLSMKNFSIQYNFWGFSLHFSHCAIPRLLKIQKEKYFKDSLGYVLRDAVLMAFIFKCVYFCASVLRQKFVWSK